MVPVKQGGTHQLLVSADAVNLLGESMYTTKKKPAREETCQNLIFLCFMSRMKDSITT
jgi:hypothetical protein